MSNRAFRFPILLLAGLMMSGVCNAQHASNLLQNPDATEAEASWRGSGEAAVETTTDNNPCFVVRNGGRFFQDVELPQGAAGQYALLIGRGASERTNANGSITDLPYLYGYMMEKGRPDRKEIRAYLQGQRMLGRNTSNEWVKMWGIFKVPDGTNAIRFFLNQALRNGDPHNGSAARFDNLGLYLFATKEEAETFASQFQW